MKSYVAGVLAAGLAIAGAATANADTVFTWQPNAVQLNGSRFSADTLLLGDYDQIVLSNGGATFQEHGYLPILGFTRGGQTVTPQGFNDPRGAGWGAYVEYSASGIQTLTPYGTPQPVYQQLTYQIVGFNGTASYAVGANGATVGGSYSNATVLERGSLIAGQLAFVPTADGLTIEGQIAASLDEVKPQFTVGPLDGFTLAIDHPPADYAFVSPTTLDIASTSGTTATVLAGTGPGRRLAAVGLAATDVPEPSALLLFGSALMGGMALRRRAIRG